MGAAHMNSFLAALEIPGLHHKSLVDREKEISTAFKITAEASCDDAIEEEKIATLHEKE